MAWEQRAEPGKETVKGLLTLIVVAGAGVTIVGLLVAAADSFSVWVLNGSLQCDVTAAGSACFGENMLTLLALTTHPAAGGLGSLLIIILGIIAILAAAFQIVLMVARGGMLVVLTGILPLSASFTSTEMGKTWFRKCIAWLVAFILYKPAAAIIYAAAFQLVGTDVFSDDGSGLLAVLTGLMLMVIALFAMPALMRFVTPMVGAMASGAGGAALAAGALAALPTGAAAIGRLASADPTRRRRATRSPAATARAGARARRVAVGRQHRPDPERAAEPATERRRRRRRKRRRSGCRWSARWCRSGCRSGCRCRCRRWWGGRGRCRGRPGRHGGRRGSGCRVKGGPGRSRCSEESW